MSRTLVVGRAGSGKTHLVLERVRELVAGHDAAGRFRRFQVLVPTYSQAEHLKRRLLREADGLPALLDRGIGTFEQLAERETGVRLASLARPAVCDALLGRALDRVDEPLFRKVRRFAGFRRATLRLAKEVKSAEPEPGVAGVGPAVDRLQAAADSLGGVRGARLDAFARTLTAYQEELDRVGLLDHEDLLLALLARLRATTAEGAGAIEFLAVDGFTDMTPVQERVVDLLAARADESLVTVLGDDGPTGTGPFAASAALRSRLVTGSGFEQSVLTGAPRLSGDRARVERVLAGADVEPAAPDGSVIYIAGADPSDEADRVGRNVRRCIAEGVPRNEILVVLRRIDSDTGHRVIDALRRHLGARGTRVVGGLPLRSEPIVRTALRVVRLLTGIERRGDLIEALRSGLARDVRSHEANRLAASSRQFQETGVAAMTSLAGHEELSSCIQWLERLAALRPMGPAAPQTLATAVLDGVIGLLRPLVEPADEGLPVFSSRSATAALRRVCGLVAEVAAGFVAADRGTIEPAELGAAVLAQAESARVAAPDRRVDVVNVVDAEEARQWEARIVVVAGLRMGEFPAGAREDLFVSDDDRREVDRKTHMRLPSRRDDALLRERMLFYGAVTRATERVILTRPMADAKGEPVLPSPFLDRLLAIFPEDARAPDGADRAPGDQWPAVGEAFYRSDAEHAALAAWGERVVAGTPAADRAAAAHVFAEALTRSEWDDDPEWPDEGPQPLVRAARLRLLPPAALNADGAAREFLAAERPRSASSLREMHRCAYRHFARKALQLEEPEPAVDDGPSALDQGNAAHTALEWVFGTGVRDPVEIEAIAQAAWDEECGSFTDGLGTRRKRHDVVRGVVERSLSEWKALARLGHTVESVERAFGMKGEDALPALVFDDGERRVTVRGQIDRIDRDADGRIVVTDWKWSKRDRYSPLGRRLDEGDELQLPIYALALEHAGAGDVSAARFVTLRDGREIALNLRDGAPSSRPAADWVEDRDERAAAFASAVLDVDARIRSGEIAAVPAYPDECPRCPFYDLCRVEDVAGTSS